MSHDDASDHLLVAIEGRAALVHIVGRGSYRVTASLIEFGVQAMAQACDSLIVDLRDCAAIDSTFMGVIAQLSSRIKTEQGGKLVLINLSERTERQLRSLGLHQLIENYNQASTPGDLAGLFGGCGEMVAGPAVDETERDRVAMMLDAHEALVDANPENLPKFVDVLSFLRDDLSSRSAEPSPGS